MERVYYGELLGQITKHRTNEWDSAVEFKKFMAKKTEHVSFGEGEEISLHNVNILERIGIKEYLMFLSDPDDKSLPKKDRELCKELLFRTEKELNNPNPLSKLVKNYEDLNSLVERRKEAINEKEKIAISIKEKEEKLRALLPEELIKLFLREVGERQETLVSHGKISIHTYYGLCLPCSLELIEEISVIQNKSAVYACTFNIQTKEGKVMLEQEFIIPIVNPFLENFGLEVLKDRSGEVIVTFKDKSLSEKSFK